jgi:hypothetical protein
MGLNRWPWIIVVILLVIVIILVIRPPCPKCPDCPPVTPTSTEMGITVDLVIDQGSQPEKPALSKSGVNNHIRWKNTTSIQRKVSFTSIWPFFEPKADIVVPAGGFSAWFTLDPAKVNATCGYQVNPSLFGPQGTPDDPAVSAGD